MTAPAGWYADAEQPGGQRYWDGQQWTEQRKPPPQPAGAAPAASQREEKRRLKEDAKTERQRKSKEAKAERQKRKVVLPAAFWWLAVIALLILLWGAAEVHDQSCYSKTFVQVASGNLSKSNCLILPWNDPVTGREQSVPFR